MQRIAASALALVMLAGCAARSSSYVPSGATAAGAAFTGPVCLLQAPLPEGTKHTVMGVVQGSKGWYGSTNELMPVMADEARKLGANAIIKIEAGQRMGVIAVVRPTGSGTAVKTDPPVDCIALGGTLR